jgi:glycosyltransferase involved in cell wall biosynthesis
MRPFSLYWRTYELMKRILLCNDSSFMSTGFGVYGRELMSRLAESGKFELAELAAYGDPRDSRQLSLPWKYYGNLYVSDEERTLYESSQTNQFGKFRFDDVCIDFKPHIVWDFRDCQMLDFIELSPARPYFHFSAMPTVDSIPLHDSWIATYMNLDSLFSWTDWGADVLKKTGLKVVDVIPPGVDSLYKPVQNKTQHKMNFGFKPNDIIIGTVMRNQPRKLFPDLINAFSMIDTDKSSRVFLYLHTNYPHKKGWNLPALLKEAGIASRTFFTYICTNCNQCYPHLYQDVRAYCKFCNQFTALTAHQQHSPSTEIMAQIYNLFDVHIQYASCEGFGLPMMEAAACGVPSFAVNYSAMTDLINKLEAEPISVERFFRNQDSNSYWALPNNSELTAKLKKFVELPESLRRNMGFRSYQKCKEHFSWEKSAKRWEEHFDEIPIENRWDNPRKLIRPNLQIPDGLSNREFITWCITHILGRTNLLRSYYMRDLTEALTYGYNDGVKVTRELLVKHFLTLAAQFNKFEEKR